MQRRRTRNTPKLYLSSRLHWATRLLFVTNWTWRYNVHPSPLRMLFLFGWPPCQRSDMTLVEVSQHAYDYLYIRTIVLFVFLRNSCKPDMVLVYILLNKLCLSLSESESESDFDIPHVSFRCRPIADSDMERFDYTQLKVSIKSFLNNCSSSPNPDNTLKRQIISTEWRIYASINWAIIGSDNGWSPVHCQAITWTKAGVSLNGPIGRNVKRHFNQNIKKKAFKEISLKILSVNGGHFVSACVCQQRTSWWVVYTEFQGNFYPCEYNRKCEYF